MLCFCVRYWNIARRPGNSHIQNEAIKIDQVVRAILCVFDEEELTRNTYYQKLLRLYGPLEPILPLTYLDTVGGKIDLASAPAKLPPGARCPS